MKMRGNLHGVGRFDTNSGLMRYDADANGGGSYSTMATAAPRPVATAPMTGNAPAVAASPTPQPVSIVQPVPQVSPQTNVPQVIPHTTAERLRPSSSTTQAAPSVLRAGPNATSGSASGPGSAAASYGPTEYYGDDGTLITTAPPEKKAASFLPIGLILWALFGT